MANKRRTYTDEFKVDAVKLVTEQGYPVAEAARSLGISENLLRSWKDVFQANGDQAFPGKGRLPAVEEELRRLRADKVCARRITSEARCGSKSGSAR
jgi:transposase